jgi:hypothetical protein
MGPLAAEGEAEEGVLVQAHDGLLRRAAKVRSSSGRSSERPRATRSRTAMESVSFSRSAPATGTSRSFRAFRMRSCAMPRRCRRIRMSPGRMGAPVASSTAPSSSQPRMVFAILSARRASASSVSKRSVGSCQPRLALARGSAGSTSGQSSTVLMAFLRKVACRTAMAGSPATALRIGGSARTASTASRMAGPERKERSRRVRSSGRSAASNRAVRRSRTAAKLSRSAPWKL